MVKGATFALLGWDSTADIRDMPYTNCEHRHECLVNKNDIYQCPAMNQALMDCAQAAS